MADQPGIDGVAWALRDLRLTVSVATDLPGWEPRRPPAVGSLVEKIWVHGSWARAAWASRRASGPVRQRVGRAGSRIDFEGDRVDGVCVLPGDDIIEERARRGGRAFEPTGDRTGRAPTVVGQRPTDPTGREEAVVAEQELVARLGPTGVWWSGSWKTDDPSVDVPAELEALGYGCLWSSAGFRPVLSSHFERLLASTRRLHVASGIVSIWTAAAEDLAGAVATLDERAPGRFLLGLGASHAPIVDRYEHPYRHMVEYLDALDRLGPPVQRDRRIVAALGPRMLELAAARSLGAHPYFVPVEHTARAREILGEGPLLAPEVTVLLGPDGGEARRRAREFTTGYLGLPNYANNLRRLGYDDEDLAGGGSDRLVDAVVARGDVEQVAARIRQHHEAGADHVAVQVLAAPESFPLAEYRDLATALGRAS